APRGVALGALRARGGAAAAGRAPAEPRDGVRLPAPDRAPGLGAARRTGGPGGNVSLWPLVAAGGWGAGAAGRGAGAAGCAGACPAAVAGAGVADTAGTAAAAAAAAATAGIAPGVVGAAPAG